MPLHLKLLTVCLSRINRIWLGKTHVTSDFAQNARKYVSESVWFSNEQIHNCLLGHRDLANQVPRTSGASETTLNAPGDEPVTAGFLSREGFPKDFRPAGCTKSFPAWLQRCPQKTSRSFQQHMYAIGVPATSLGQVCPSRCKIWRLFVLSAANFTVRERNVSSRQAQQCASTPAPERYRVSGELNVSPAGNGQVDSCAAVHHTVYTLVRFYQQSQGPKRFQRARCSIRQCVWRFLDIRSNDLAALARAQPTWLGSVTYGDNTSIFSDMLVYTLKMSDMYTN